MSYYVLDYSYVDDYLARRDAYREAHLDLIREYHRRGDLFMAGAMTEAPPRGLLVWRTEGPGPAEEFVRRDPYVANGLVDKWSIRPWNVVDL
ncbi:YciI family protein [Streptomyces sp. NBC_01808]|uniref:YciI family protein n=1 Tax=Streptomyces sp. NBC_01808 TaxID=2975947 RepID=UPI002DDC131A|nr:YciI family protein [Streptomyces sp. NBC_01808]WSA40462.1 YciI family protein [Streptomyces sp. NBC_01808]